MAENKAVDAESLAESKKAKRASPKSFPTISLERALDIPKALKEKNAGNAWDPKLVAKAVDISQKSTNFLYLVNAAKDYGLITGTARGENIELTPLGRSVVYAESPEAEFESKRMAFLSVKVFSEALDYYKGSKLPEMEYLANVLTTKFSIHTSHHNEFVTVFSDNCRYLNIGDNYVSEARNSGGIKPSAKAIEVIRAGSSTHVSAGGVNCFVAMPFSEKTDMYSVGFFSEVLKSLIIPAAETIGYSASTASKDGSDIIQSTIVNDLLQADLVIADLTEHNPNVLFELGMRMAEDKPVALIRAKGTGTIFDVDNMLRVYEYSPCLWQSTLADDIPSLAKHIKASWENRETNMSFMKILRQRAK